MRERRLVRLSIAFSAVVLLGTSVRAGTVEDETERLETLLYFVTETDRAWPQMLAELEASVTMLEGRPPAELLPLLTLRDQAVFSRAEALFATGDVAHEARCVALYGRLADSAVDPVRRSSARRRLADIHILRGERFENAGDDAAALREYQAAVDNAPDYEAGFAKVGALGVKQARSQESAQEFDAALSTLSDVLARIETGLPAGHPDLQAARSLQQQILSGTGVLSLEFLGDVARLEGVRGPKTDFRTGTIMLSPTSGGATPPAVAAAAPRRVRAGDYSAMVTGSGGSFTVQATVRITSEGGSITVPALVPEGMVWVPAAGNASSFLCDRGEVSNAEFAEFAREQGGTSLGGSPDNAASGISLSDARRYAQWVGKELPTLAQWTHAAFGAPRAGSPRYPWGDREGSAGRHFHFGDTPGPVGGCAEGASAAGVLNLAGNVFEWLADGWLIGGGHTAGVFETDAAYTQPVNGQASWKADILRDRIPTMEIYRDLAPPDVKNKYDTYRVAELEADLFMREVGLRCVIPLE